MKKSELVKKLTQFGIDGQHFDLRDQYPGITARHIIDFLEEAGMHPPYVIEPCQTHIVVANFDGQMLIQTEDSKSFVSKWETEDET